MSGTNFSVVSWNVNSVNARLEHVLSFLRNEKPTVLCLQELKCTDEGFPLLPFKELGYDAIVHGQKTYNGVALLSNTLMQEDYFGFDGKRSENSARLVGAKLGKIFFYSVYVPNGQEVGSEKYKEKLEFFKSLRSFLEARHKPTDAVVISGDFNVAPEEIDVHDPPLWRGNLLFSDRERKALKDLMEWGLVDTYRTFAKERREYSWWDYRGASFQKNNGLRIDFVFCTKPLGDHLTKAGIHREFRKLERPSDHAPCFANFLVPSGFLGH